MHSGFFGKLPSRGDLLRLGLPRSFTDPWDAWLQARLPDCRARLGADWTLCWLEAPVWRFALAPGVCGPDAVLGLFVPSVDGVGRDYPLTLAAVSARPHTPTSSVAWLDAAEQAACDAVTGTAEPEWLAAAVPPFDAADPGREALPDPDGGAVWWTEGAPRVAPVRFSTRGLPGPAAFAGMLHSIEETA